MEDDDELVPQVDDKGVLILSNRAWVNLDASIWLQAAKIVKLDISYNHIQELPPQIGEMVMLREFIGCFNKIQAIPKEIGSLRRLRKLVLNTNRIRIIPAELGNCEVLEELILSENMIEELPTTLAKIQNLRILKMANNKLKSIPFEIADILTLEDFDCGNNPHLESIPPKWRGDTESVLFTLRVHRASVLSLFAFFGIWGFVCPSSSFRLSDYNVQMNEMVQANRDLARHSQMVEQDNLLLKEKILQLQAKIEDLNKNMPKKIAKRMEEEAKRQREAELSLENEDEKKQNQCVLS